MGKENKSRRGILKRDAKRKCINSQREENADSLLHEDGHVLRLLRHHVAEDALGARRLLTPPRVSVPGELRQETVLGPLAAHHAVRERNSVLVVRQLVLLTNSARQFLMETLSAECLTHKIKKGEQILHG